MNPRGSWTILRRESTSRGVIVTQVETDLDVYDLSAARRYYRETYLHDDKNGTEVTYLKNGRLHAVDTVVVPSPSPVLDGSVVEARI